MALGTKTIRTFKCPKHGYKLQQTLPRTYPQMSSKVLSADMKKTPDSTGVSLRIGVEGMASHTRNLSFCFIVGGG